MAASVANRRHPYDWCFLIACVLCWLSATPPWRVRTRSRPTLSLDSGVFPPILAAVWYLLGVLSEPATHHPSPTPDVQPVAAAASKTR